MDIVRILRIVEYVGPRDLVETCIERSLQGTKIIRQPDPQTGGAREYRIRVATLGNVAEILGEEENANGTEDSEAKAGLSGGV